MNYNNNNFPSMGSSDQQQMGYQQVGQQPVSGFVPQTQFGQQQQLGGYQSFPPPGQPQYAAPQNPVATTSSSAAASNPFATNPFASGASSSSAASSNPFAAGSVKEFKPKVAKGIMDDDDDAPVDFAAFGQSKKNKKKTAEELAAEKAKAKAAAEAALPTKGKPSSFFVMDYAPGDPRDLSGGCRVPNQEQRVFIYTHYPTCSADSMMIAKIYELYAIAFNMEQAELAEKDAYGKKPVSKGQRQEVE